MQWLACYSEFSKKQWLYGKILMSFGGGLRAVGSVERSFLSHMGAIGSDRQERLLQSRNAYKLTICKV